MNTSSPSRKPGSWARDLRHPLFVAAVLVLAVNDHVLKGAGVVPTWLTGKLSDLAGMFFFPVLLTALVEGGRQLLGRVRLHVSEQRRRVVVLTTIATGVSFTLLKTSAPFNAWLTTLWGVNSMDVTDLLALPMLPASAWFMLRAPRPSSSVTAARVIGPGTRTRRVFDLAAATLAAVASMATSQARPPVVAQPVHRAAIARSGCATLHARVCERSANNTFVVIEATTDADACEVSVGGAREMTQDGMWAAVDQLPAPVTVSPDRPATFSLAFLRPIHAPELASPLSLEIEVGHAAPGEQPIVSAHELGQVCTPR